MNPFILLKPLWFWPLEVYKFEVNLPNIFLRSFEQSVEEEEKNSRTRSSNPPNDEDSLNSNLNLAPKSKFTEVDDELLPQSDDKSNRLET